MKLGSVEQQGPATYLIIDPETGKRYVGSTGNIRQRIHQHLTGLRNNCHKNHNLNKAYNKNYGNLELIVFEQDSFKEAFELENKLLDDYKETGLLLNVHLSNNSQVEETKNKISKTLTGFKRSKENRENISRGKIGIKLSYAHRESISLSKKNPVTVNGIEYENHGIAAKSLNVKIWQIPTLSKGREIRPPTQKVLIKGIQYNSIAEATRKTEFTKKQLERRLNGKNSDFQRI